MRGAPALVRLGEQEWRVRPLTLKQIQEIEPLLRQDEGGSIAAAIKIVGVALTRDHPEAAAKLDECEATTREIGAAMRAVLRLGGFVPDEDKERAPGEAQAGADSISPSSTPA